MLKIGHRGAAGLAPENTLKSFEKALELGVDAIEFDVRAATCGTIVSFHDPTLERMTGGDHKQRVSECSYVYLKDVLIGGWPRGPLAGQSPMTHFLDGKGLYGEQIPTLEEVLKKFGTRTILNIELKEEGIAKTVLNLIRTYDLVDSVIMSAFDDNENEPGDSSNWVDLLWMKRREPKLKIALLVGKEQNLWRARDLAAVYQVHAVAIAHELVKSKAFNRVVEYGWLSNPGLKVLVYTVNDVEEMKKLNEMGFDGIFSDYPDRFKEAGV